MAEIIHDLRATTISFATKTNPSTNYYNPSVVSMYYINQTGQNNQADRAFLQFVPNDTVKRKRLVNAILYLCMATPSPSYVGNYGFNMYPYQPSLPTNLQDITYNRIGYRDSAYWYGKNITMPSGGAGWSSSQLLNPGVMVETFFSSQRGIIEVSKDPHANGLFAQNATFYFYGISGTNTPYLRLYLDDPNVILSVRPSSSGYINPWIDNEFSWSITWDAVGGNEAIVQRSATLQWRLFPDGAVNTIPVSGNTRRVTVPANTFPAQASMQYQVNVVLNDGTTSSSGWLFKSTTDSLPTFIPLKPSNELLNGSEPVTFTWTHQISTGTIPMRGDLQYSTNSIDWTDLTTIIGSDRSYVSEPDTLPGGTVYWRGRTYNSDSVASEWCEPVSFVVRAAPSVPSIENVTVSGKPTVSWQAAYQSSYEVTFIDQNGMIVYNSGPVASLDKYHKVRDFLPDGTYTVRVRVQNTYQLWSDYAATTIDLATDRPNAPTILAVEMVGYAEITTTFDDGLTGYLLKDGVPIAKFDETKVYLDYTASGRVSYMVRAIDENDNYADSDIVEVIVLIEYATIAGVSNPQAYIALEYRGGQFPGHDTNRTTPGALSWYSGRKYPIYEHAGQLSEVRNIAFSIKNRFIDGLFALKNLYERQETVIFRTYQGDSIFGYIRTFNDSRGQNHADYAMSLDRVDYSLRIDYDEV